MAKPARTIVINKIRQMLEGKLLSKFDKKIFKSLANIESDLENYLQNSGYVTFELNGKYKDVSFLDWSFREPFKSAILKRQKKIYYYLENFEFDDDNEPKDVLNAISKWVAEREMEAQKNKQENYIATEPRKEIMVPKFFSRLEGDPLILSYKYTKGMFDSGFIESNSQIERFKNNIYGKEFNTAKIIKQWSELIEWEELNEFSSADSKRSVALQVAELEIFKEYLNNMKFPKYEDSLNLFLYDFLGLPNFYLNEREEKADFGLIEKLVEGLKSLFHKDIKEYRKSDKELIINFPTYLSYKASISLLDREIFDNFWIYKYIYTPTLSAELTKLEVVLAELMSFISLRIEFLDRFFDVILNKLLKIPYAKKYFAGKGQLIEYFIKYLKDLQNHSDKFHIFIFQRIKLPQDITHQIFDCILTIFENHLAINNGTAYQNLLLPHEYDSVGVITSFGNRLQEIGKQDKNEIIIPTYFTDKKLRWPIEKIKTLESWFSQLYIQKNKDNQPFMSQDDVDYLLKTNFNCFHNTFKPLPLEFNGKTDTLIDYIYHFYYNDNDNYNTKNRYGQFLVQNFSCFNDKANTKKDFDNFYSNTRPKPLKRNEKIFPPQK